MLVVLHECSEKNSKELISLKKYTGTSLLYQDLEKCEKHIVSASLRAYITQQCPQRVFHLISLVELGPVSRNC